MAQASMKKLSKVDFSLFNKAAAFYREGRLVETVNTLNEFKTSSGIKDLTILPLKQAYFEVISCFQAGTANDNEDILTQCVNASHKVLSEYKHELSMDYKLNIWTILAESYSALRYFERAAKYFDLVTSNSSGAIQPEIWFKYFTAKIESQNIDGIELIEERIISDVKFELMMQLHWLKFYVKAENRMLSENKAEILIQRIDELDVSSQITLIKIYVSDLSKTDFDVNKIKQLQLVSNDKNLPILEATLYFKKKEFNLAIECLLASPESASTAGGASLIAKSYEKLSDYDNAWKYFSLSAEYQDEIVNKHKKQFLDLNTDYISLSHEELLALSLKISAEKILQKDKLSPTFIMGFPRSGTTLLDTVFKANDNLVVLSEHPFMHALVDRMATKFNKKYPQDLVKLTNDELNDLRSHYETLVAQKVKVQLKLNIEAEDLSQIKIVDKNPLNTEHLPLILLLYPLAKVLMSIRHPLDVVLSCFQQNFENISQYTSVDKCAKKYGSVFTFYHDVKNTIEFDLKEVRYEDLVNSFKEEMQALSSFLNLELDINADQKFSEVAKTRVINTASRDQVTQGLYSNSLERWKNYEVQMLPVKEQLNSLLANLHYI